VAGCLLRAPVVAWLALLGSCVTPPALPPGRWVDLSHDYAADTIYWPTSGGFELEVLDAGVTDKGYWYAANRFATAEHGGTHVDAPIHFAEGRLSVDRLPLERLTGPAVVVDVSAAAATHSDHVVGVEELLDWEAVHGRIPSDAIVLLRTRYGRFWHERARYLGTALTGPQAVPELHFPGLGEEAARWLVEHRRVAAVGIDTASIDPGQSTLFESHRVLAANDVPVFENVARLEDLPATGALVFALPMKIRGGSGAPLRIVARVPAARR
jgi:kynurenine formamidase